MAETPLTDRIGPERKPPGLAEYRRAGGYKAVDKALRHLSPEDVRNQVTESNLRGRGGAGFPTGKKWSFVPQGDDAPTPKYLVVNADEMEPGTFKDRLLLEGDPHQMIEAVILSAYAIGASQAYIFLRGEYVTAARVLRQAIAEAKDAGLLGHRIRDTDFSLELHLHMSAGRYICGEETALLSALEGRRALPRTKPPYPQAAGLWGYPTVVNNVETLCNVPHIVAHGGDWFQSLSHTDDGGTKIYGVSGRVRKPGLWELPMGTTAREIIEEHAGGMRDGYRFRGLLPGGASTDFIVAEHLDLPLDFSGLSKAGSRLGTGTMIILDDHTCPVGMCLNMERFFAQESCGWCTPCRDGLPLVTATLAAIEAGRGRPEDLDLLEQHTRLLGMGNTFCAHAPGAMEPLQSALKHFRDDFEQHIREGRCPYR
ncbi:MAG: NADH-quinone oxidoreductase subunit NuoF [Thiohalocapsa sp.]|uniref:NADH-quinone oxidoreductase subunit NuoF n=1 Tax=Thiohalocapsa sp. TaxID=2497641 RepID=UPI0025E2EC93|nr:NADH-quinone oxidoreductase subunit NuoF [Thiohalocapsa sp.]MCG6943702.1 NADH-quinone oxidoreductase subunit NuoF [Thiohalocapsa sp.]